MTFTTDLTTAMNRILNLTGTQTVTTFESVVETIRLTSKDVPGGRKNRSFVLKEMNLQYLPRGGESIRVAYSMDNETTRGFDIDLNPYQRPVLGAAGTNNATFTLDSSAVVDSDETYTIYKPLEGQGKTAIFTFTMSNQVQAHIVGMELGVTMADKDRVYVREVA